MSKNQLPTKGEFMAQELARQVAESHAEAIADIVDSVNMNVIEVEHDGDEHSVELYEELWQALISRFWP